jgi:hypothetical protein
MNMPKPILVLAAVLGAASAAAAQDTLRVRDPKDGKISEKQGEVVTLTHKLVEIEQDLSGTRVKVQEDARNVVELIPDQNGRTFDYIQAEQALNNGNWDEAIQRFEKVRVDARARDILKQMSAINVVRAQWGKENAAGTIAAAKGLRQEKGDSFFVRESFELEIQANLAKNDIAGANGAISAFEEKGKADGMPDWAKSAEVKRARLLELQGKHRDALAIHRKYARDRDAGEEATLGELRCLKMAPDFNALNAKAEAVINEARGKKGVSARLLTGAFNARAEAALNAGKVKEALLDFLQGAMVLNKSGETSLEHEAALGGGAVTCAMVATAEKEKAKKDTYKHRAQELHAELKKFYPGSKLLGAAEAAIQAVK